MKLFFLIISIFLMLYSLPLQADEGMWPITEIDRIGLQSKGLTIPIEDIYNPEGISLMQAIVESPLSCGIALGYQLRSLRPAS